MRISFIFFQQKFLNLSDYSSDNKFIWILRDELKLSYMLQTLYENKAEIITNWSHAQLIYCLHLGNAILAQRCSEKMYSMILYK